MIYVRAKGVVVDEDDGRLADRLPVLWGQEITLIN